MEIKLIATTLPIIQMPKMWHQSSLHSDVMLAIAALKLLLSMPGPAHPDITFRPLP